MIKLVSWDVDGTLFSYRQLAWTLIRLAPVSEWTWRELRQTFRFHRLVEAQRRSCNSRVCEEDLVIYASTCAREKQVMRAALSRMRPPENVQRTLEGFQRAGITQVALSDFECNYKVRALGIHRYFTKTFSCREFGFWKPSPIPLSEVQTEFGVRPGEHLHIGDRDAADGQACIKNGCRSAKPTVSTSALLAIINID
jgi:FMN phosphatase YigB (HAD superfamily)